MRPTMWIVLFAIAFVAVSAANGPDPEKALREFRERSAAAKKLGDRSPPELFYNLALAALDAGAIEDAEIAAEKAAARGGETFYARRDFLLARAAWQKSEQAEAAAEMQNQNPVAYGRAILHAETALREWRSVLIRDPDFDVARRNAERAAARIESLKKKRELAIQQPPKKDGAAPPKGADKGGEKRTENDPTADEENQNRRRRPELPRSAPPEAKTPTALPAELADDQVKRLFEKLGEKDREKKKTRRARVEAGRTDVEKDW